MRITKPAQFMSVVLLLCVSETLHINAQIRIVSPPGLESTEGNSSALLATRGFRTQEIIPATSFQDLPHGGAWLVGITDRVDRSQRRETAAQYSDMRLTVSTTDRDTVSGTFAENTGADEVMVFDGELDRTFSVTSESPNPFGAIWEFQTPYFYDPSRGNLLFDFVSNSGTNGAFLTLDSHRIGKSIGNHGPPNAARANGFFQDSIVTEFHFELAQIGDFDLDRTLDIDDINRLTMESASETGNGRFDLTNDEIVNEDDIREWVTNLAKSWMGDSNLDGEFNSGDLIDVFQVGKFELDAEANWSDGDWNGDGRFNSGDMVSAFQDGGFERGPRIVAQAVPEPSCLWLVFPAIVALIRWTRRTI